MKIIVDNQIVKLLSLDAADIMKNPLISDQHNQLTFRWPSFLESLRLGSLFSNLPIFNEREPLFVATISTLHTTEEKEVVFHIYDHLFIENLNQIKALGQIQPSFLLEAINKEKEKGAFFSLIFDSYEKAFIENRSHAIHDLILYLAWDRMCVWIARIFNYQSGDLKFIKNLRILKECLVESYQHITFQRKTAPGVYRMLEAVFFYQMREENLQKHTPSEWELLTKSFSVLKGELELADFFYIDDAILSEESSECYLTQDSQDRVALRLALAQYIVDKLKTEFSHWGYTLRRKKIIHLENNEKYT
jgi:hypothetical protein